MTIAVETGILGWGGAVPTANCVKFLPKIFQIFPPSPLKLFLPPEMKQMMPSVYCTWLQHPYHTCSIWPSCSAYFKRSQQKHQKQNDSFEQSPGHSWRFWESGSGYTAPFNQKKPLDSMYGDYNLNLVIWDGFFGYLGEHPCETRVQEGLTKKIQWFISP